MNDSGTDPLAGRDAYPQHEVDLIGLNGARQELLEEIVSTPGAGQHTPASRRVLVPVGIAAAIVIVAGGAWLATSGDGDDEPAPAAAPESTATDAPASDGPEPTVSASPTPSAVPTEKSLEELRVGDVLARAQCGRVVRGGDLPKELVVLERPRRDGDGAAYYLYLSGDRHWVAVSKECRVVDVGPRPIRELRASEAPTE